MKKDLKEAKQKIEMLVNHLCDTIDVDLLSDVQKVQYFKALAPYVMPRLESVKQETSVQMSENLEWLFEADEKEIDDTIKNKIGIGSFGSKGLA